MAMATQTYGIISAKKQEFPLRELLIVPHKGKELIIAYLAFSPNHFKNNIAEMQKYYISNRTRNKLSPTTSY